jgi:anti-sigma regulatory factor (Ser/Thr protein kinase)
MAALPPHPADSTGCRWLMPAAQMAGLACDCWRSSPDPAMTGWDRVPTIATRALSAEDASVRAARDFTLATLRLWGTPHNGQDIAVVVSELVTNALRHALPGAGDTGPRGPVLLGLLQHGRWLLCAVADPANAAPVPRTPGVLAEAGRGLQMICALSDQWGYTTPSDEGKIVWAMFTARSAPPSPAPYAHRRDRRRVAGPGG